MGRLAALVEESPQVPEEERASYLTPAFLSSVSTLDPVSYLPGLKVKSLRIQQIMDNAITPKSARESIASAVPASAKLVQFASSEGHFEAMHRVGVSAWLKDQLEPESATRVSPSLPALTSGLFAVSLSADPLMNGQQVNWQQVSATVNSARASNKDRLHPAASSTLGNQ